MKAIYQKPALVVVQLQSSFSLLTGSEGISATLSGYRSRDKEDEQDDGFSQVY